MAEAFAIIGLVAAIADLVGLGKKVIGRLNEFDSARKEVPESFRAIATQLPLHLDTLQFMKTQAETGDISSTSAQALERVVSTSIDLTKKLENILAKALPPENATTFEKRLAALRSLGKDKKVLECRDKLESNINLLIFFQTTHHSEAQSTIRRMEKQQEAAEREAEKTAIQKWLSPFSFWTRQDELCKDRCMTGDWFLKDETFQSWVLGPPRYLFCYGEAGAGKVCTWAQLIRMFAPDKPTL